MQRTVHRPSLSQASKPMPLVLLESTSAVSIEYLGVVLLACAVLGCVLYLLHNYQKNKALEEGELLERPNVIRSLLTAALDSRSRLDIFLANGQRLPRPLAGCIEKIGSKTLHITLGSAALPANLRSFPLLFYFHLGSGHDKIFYSFTSSISEITTFDGHFSMEIALPKILTNAQKRDFVRICPGPGMIEAMVVWKIAPVPSDSTLPATAQILGSPHFSYRPPKAAQAALVDISGGGVLLRIAGERLAQVQIQFAAGDSCCILVLVHDIETDKILTIWLAGICRRVRCPQNTANIDVGVQFTHWAQVEKLSMPIHWSPVLRDGEVPSLLAWTLRVQTLLTRKKQ